MVVQHARTPAFMLDACLRQLAHARLRVASDQFALVGREGPGLRLQAVLFGQHAHINGERHLTIAGRIAGRSY